MTKAEKIIAALEKNFNEANAVMLRINKEYDDAVLRSNKAHERFLNMLVSDVTGIGADEYTNAEYDMKEALEFEKEMHSEYWRKYLVCKAAYRALQIAQAVLEDADDDG